MNSVPLVPEDLLPQNAGTRALYERLTEQKEFDPALFQQLMESAGLEWKNRLFVAVCFGVRPDFGQVLSKRSYSEFSILNLRLYHEIETSFRERALGFEVSRGQYYILLLCTLPKNSEGDYIENLIRPELNRLETLCNVTLLAGVGRPESNPAQMKRACESARYAFGLYFFETAQIMDARSYARPGERACMAETYEESMEAAIKAVLMKDDSALEQIDHVIDVLGELHYGNRMAVLMRTLDFSGHFVTRLRHYHLLNEEFIAMQDELQDEVLSAKHFLHLKEIIHWHFKRRLPIIYKSEKLRGKLVVEAVKDYMRDHYMDDLNIEELSRIAFVSPNYFSHLFKNETGQSYKSFLTAIRMNHAVGMLKGTEHRVYEIAELVGYNNTRTFVEAFRQIYRVSPTEFRRRQQIQSE